MMRTLLILASVLPTLIRAEEVPVLAPHCATSAPLEEHTDNGIEGFWILLKKDAPIADAESFLAMKYGFMIHGHLGMPEEIGFTVLSLTPTEIAELRCERYVKSISRLRGT